MERLQPILAKLSRYQTAAQPGCLSFAPVAGMELRVGGKNAQGQIKQLQTVIPPNAGTDVSARVSMVWMT